MWFQTLLAYFQLVFTIVDKMGKKEYASLTTSNELCVILAMFLQLTKTSVHSPDQSVDLILPVTSVSPLHKVCGLLVHTTTG